MAGVYIKGMEMPKSCFYCPFREKANPDDYVCMAMNREFEETFALIAGRRHKDCPLVEVPDHGDLIEKPILIDELAISEEPDDCSGCASYNSYDDFCCRSLDFQTMCKSIRTAPVVIPAERSEDE